MLLAITVVLIASLGILASSMFTESFLEIRRKFWGGQVAPTVRVRQIVNTGIAVGLTGIVGSIVTMFFVLKR